MGRRMITRPSSLRRLPAAAITRNAIHDRKALNQPEPGRTVGKSPEKGAGLSVKRMVGIKRQAIGAYADIVAANLSALFHPIVAGLAKGLQVAGVEEQALASAMRLDVIDNFGSGEDASLPAEAAGRFDLQAVASKLPPAPFPVPRTISRRLVWAGFRHCEEGLPNCFSIIAISERIDRNSLS